MCQAQAERPAAVPYIVHGRSCSLEHHPMAAFLGREGGREGGRESGALHDLADL